MTPFVEEMSPAPDPVRCCEALEGLPYRLFLDSASTASRFGRYSFLTADPVAIVRSRGAEVECLDLRTGARRESSGDPLVALRELVMPYAAEPVSGLPPFQGGAAGYVAYDWGLTLERLPAPRYDDLGLPDLVLGFYDWVIAWDHESSRAWLISTGIPERTADARRARAAARAAFVKKRLAALSDQRPRTPAPPATAASHPRTDSPLRTVLSSGSDLVARLFRVEIVVHPQRISATRSRGCASTSSPATSSRPTCRSDSRRRPPNRAWSFYTRLRQRNAAPFAAFLDFPDVVGRQRIAGAFSPCRCQWATSRRARSRDAAARSRPRARRRARTGAGRERQGSRREPDDRGSDAQRSVARLCARTRCACPSCSRSSTMRRCITWSRQSLASSSRRRCHRSVARGVSRWIHYRRAEVEGDGSDCGARAVAARCLLRIDRLLERDRRARHQHRHPDRRRAGRPRLLQCRRRNRRRLRSRQEYLETLDKARAMIDALADR